MTLDGAQSKSRAIVPASHFLQGQYMSRLPLQDVQSKRSLGIHCCTFAMTDEPLDEPPKRVRAASRAEGLADDEFIVMQHGGLISTADGKDYSVPPML